MKQLGHTSVLAKEVLELLEPQKGETVLDCTLGLGGHAALLGKAVGEGGKLIALDADADNIEIAKKHVANQHVSATIHHINFGSLADLHLEPVDIIFADLGLSSAHLDDPERGFSFRFEGPLDLRFDRTRGETAAEMIASVSEEELADVLYHYGELRQSRRLAKEMKEKQPHTTKDLVAAVESVCGWRAKSFLAQVFQALRIAVNQELQSLDHLLQEGIKLLKPGGRMGIISFHSLEDRVVKQFFRALTTPEKDPITGADISTPEFTLVTKKAIQPSEAEISENPRARSARFRVLARVGSHSA